MLFATAVQQVHRHRLESDALQLQRDPHPVRRAGTPIRKQLRSLVHGVLAGWHNEQGKGPPRRPMDRLRLAAASRCAVRWAPNKLRPSRSSISMRTTSPKLMNGVLGLPSRSVSTVRRSAKQEAPRLVSLVGDGAGADDGARRQRASLGRMRHQLGEIELHVLTRLRRTEPLAIDMRQQRQMQLVATPVIAQFVRRDEHRRQRRARLGLEKAEALASSDGIRLRSDTSLTNPTTGYARPPARDSPPSAHRRDHHDLGSRSIP